MSSSQSSSDMSSGSSANSMPFLNSLVYDGAVPRSTGLNRSWDVAACCQPLSSTFNYLSSKLAFQGLHVAVVVLSSRPELLAAWPIDIHTQHFLGKLIARADVKYSLDTSWVKAFNDLCRPVDAREAFEVYRSTTYLIHRSLLQKDIIFSGDGLTVLAVDYIYKFKEHLTTLASENTFPLFRDDCKESSVELLRHINSIYRDIPLSRSYLQRAYGHLSFREDILEEVCEAYHAKYSLTLTPASSNLLDSEETHSIQERPFVVHDQLQESPRKLPSSHSHRKAKPSKSFSVRTGSDAIVSLDKLALGSPFVFDPSFKWQQEDALARPRSPKGDLFESARSAPSTPSRGIGLRRLSKTEDLRSAHTVPHITDVVSHESTQAETASVISTRRRRLLAPWFSLTRSKSASSTNRDEGRSKKWSSNLSSKSAGYRSNVPPPSLEAALHRLGTTTSISSFGATNTNNGFTAPVKDETVIRTIELRPTVDDRSNSRGTDSKFGWLHVVKKNGWSMPLSQRVL